MALPDIALDIDVPSIDQIGIVVEDLEDGMDRFGAILGAQPWRVYDFEPPALSDTAFRGRTHEQAWTLALTTVGSMDIELIQPIEGETTYTEHLDTLGEGIHHIACFTFDEPADIVEEYTAEGIPIEQEGVYRGSRFWYLDLREHMNGLLFELVDVEGGPSEPDRVYPSDS